MRTRSGLRLKKIYKKVRINKKIINNFCEIYNIHPDDINRGHCYNFAIMLKKMYNNPYIKLCTCYCGSHAWININNKNYDTYNINGSKINLCDCNGFKKYKYKFFVRDWNKRGLSGPINVDKINKAMNYKKVHYKKSLFENIKNSLGSIFTPYT